MSAALIYTLSCTIVGIFIIVAVLFISQKRPLTHVNYFIADKNYPIFHILGYEYISPENGDSFEVYKHYIFNWETKKFERLAKQNGTGIDLESAFIKRSLQDYEIKYQQVLNFGVQAKRDEWVFLQHSENPHIEIHFINGNTSDTQVAAPLGTNALVFTQLYDSSGPFNVTLRRNKRDVQTHRLNGTGTSGILGFYNSKNKQLSFTYSRKKNVRYGAGLCIIDYETGELLFDDFIA